MFFFENQLDQRGQNEKIQEERSSGESAVPCNWLTAECSPPVSISGCQRWTSIRGAAGRIYGAFLFTIRKVYDFHIFIAYFVAYVPLY